MRVLVTNDDGVGSDGLGVLATVAADAGLDVVVAAPARDFSGVSAAMTAEQDDGGILAERREIRGLPETPGYAVAAAPAYIVAMACGGAFGPAPDLVLSGVNAGPNLGRAVVHSGTVGAALAAQLRGRRAMAVSLAFGDGPATRRWSRTARHWPTARHVATRLLPRLVDGPSGLLLNVNVPNVPVPELAGLRTATLQAFGAVQVVVHESGEGLVRLSWEADETELDPDGDEALLRQGYATVTALSPVREDTDARVLPEGRLPWQTT